MHVDGVYYPPSGGPIVPVPREPCDPIMALLQELEVCEGMSHGAAHVQPQRRPRRMQVHMSAMKLVPQHMSAMIGQCARWGWSSRRRGWPARSLERSSRRPTFLMQKQPRPRPAPRAAAGAAGHWQQEQEAGLLCTIHLQAKG